MPLRAYESRCHPYAVILCPSKGLDLTIFIDLQQLETVPHETLLDFELDGDDSEGVWNVVREGLYAINVAQVKAIFPASQVLVINKDDMIANPITTLRQLEQFYGLNNSKYPTRAISSIELIHIQRKR
eukprot:m.117932 g.117932  ORF g.117932 m.117932 type:complete len:128 (+) comp15556_c0_seq6:25-408(+)